MAVRPAKTLTLPPSADWHGPEGAMQVFTTTASLAANAKNFWVYPPFSGTKVDMVFAQVEYSDTYTYGAAFSCNRTVTTSAAPANYINIVANNMFDAARTVDVMVFFTPTKAT